MLGPRRTTVGSVCSGCAELQRSGLASAMELSFATKTLRAECLEQATAEEAYGPTVAAGLRAALADLDAAVTVADLPAATSLQLTENELRAIVAPGWTLVCVPGGRVRGQASFKWADVYRLKLMEIVEDQ